MKDADRCAYLDGAGRRCLLPKGHRGPHDPSLTPWAGVLDLRSKQRMQAIRDGALALKGGS
jgi:hypothetical protein